MYKFIIQYHLRLMPYHFGYMFAPCFLGLIMFAEMVHLRDLISLTGLLSLTLHLAWSWSCRKSDD